MITDDELIAAIEAEQALALDGRSGELARERADALDRYRGLPLGNEVDGRSQVVDKSVFDTIEWIMPSLVRIYLGGDDIGKFEPRSPEDEAAANQETEVCNWYLEAKNDFYAQINATLRDALLLKNGYMVGYWQMRYDTMTETYIGKTDDELAMLMNDPEVEVVEHTEYADPSTPPMHMMPNGQPMQGMMPGEPQMPAPMLHDVKVERKRCEEYVQVESVPPDEILVSRRHRWTSVLDADFVQWKRRVTIGQLRAEGFKVPDDLPSDEDFDQEWVERERFQDVRNQDDETPDPSRRVVTFRDTYMRIDLRGKGMPQLWRICKVDGSRQIVLKEEADIVPFAAFSPIIYPHSHIGMSVYDLINDIGNIKTTLQRQFLDGVYLANSGRVALDSTRVNLDDALVSRPGGIVRVEGNPGDAIMPLAGVDVSASVLGALEYMDGIKESRTGVTRYSAGLDANTLNKTATGVQAIQSAANQRIEMIARTLAGGFKDLFLIVHALACKHSQKPLAVKLSNKWVTVNPREWTRRTDFKITVGLGTGTPESQMQKLLAMQPVIQGEMAVGLAGPMEIYNYSAELWKAAGYKLPDKFVHPPATDPNTGQPIPPPQQPHPMVQAEQVKAQASMQMAQVKAQADQQIESARAQADMQIQQHKVQTDAALEEAKMRMQLQLDDIKHSREQATQIEIAKIKAAAQVQAADITATKQAQASFYPQEMSQ